MRVITVNLNGIRAAMRKGLLDWLHLQHTDFLCIQELKAQEKDITPSLRELAGLSGYFHFAEKPGYSGVSIYTRHQPDEVCVGMNHREFDAEGRYVELRFEQGERPFSLISCYFPSGTSSEQRQAVKYRFLDNMFTHLQKLRQSREILLCGDINIAHREIDLKNWKGNLNNSGFLPEERAWMDQLLQQGFVDVQRRLHPELEIYTWWSQRGQARKNNVGWRIDYHIATPAIAQLAQQAYVYTAQAFSDHAPLCIDYATLPLATTR